MIVLSVCKIGFTNWNAKIAFLRASMVVTYYIKLFRMGADRRNGILMSVLLLVAETINLRKLYITLCIMSLIKRSTRKNFEKKYGK